MSEVEHCLGNLRTLLETFEFSDEAGGQVLVADASRRHSMLHEKALINYINAPSKMPCVGTQPLGGRACWGKTPDRWK